MLQLKLAEVDRKQVADRGPEHLVGGIDYREVDLIRFDPERSQPCGDELLGSVRTLHSGGQPYSGRLAGIVQVAGEHCIAALWEAESWPQP